jgi:hypothetical protein
MNMRRKLMKPRNMGMVAGMVGLGALATMLMKRSRQQ